MEPFPKRPRLNPVDSNTESSDVDSFVQSHYADSDESTTADEFYEARPGLLASPTADLDCSSDADSWWAVGPTGPLSFLMQLDFDLLDRLNFYDLSSGEALPNHSGWVLDDGVLFELASDLEAGVVRT